VANEITLGQLLPQMEAQATRMSVKNPARRVLWIAAQVLIQQAQQIQQFREKAAQEEQRLVTLA
jgi:hypothetical protein